MAGAFSGHLVDSFNRQSIVTSGAMSFNSQAHGLPATLPFTGPSEETAIKIATLQAKLNQKLGPEFISQRPGPGGGPKLTYAEGWKIINLANEVFGFNGWSSSVVNITTDFVDYNEESRRYNVGVTAIVRVTLRDGVYHEDVGYGLLENSKSKGAALDKVILIRSENPMNYNHVTVQEGGRDGCSQTNPAEFWKPPWELSVRQNICSGSRQDQSSTRANEYLV